MDGLKSTQIRRLRDLHPSKRIRILWVRGGYLQSSSSSRTLQKSGFVGFRVDKSSQHKSRAGSFNDKQLILLIVSTLEDLAGVYFRPWLYLIISADI